MMYGRAIRSLYINAGQIIKAECLAQQSTVKSSLAQHTSLPACSAVALRFCSILNPPQKDDIANEKLQKLLEDPGKQKHYQILELEMEVLRQSGDTVPSVLRPRHWLELMQLDSRSKRRRYLQFLFICEKKKENQVTKKKSKAEERLKGLAELDAKTPENALKYGLGHNTYFLRFYDPTINHFYNWRCLRAMMFGQKLVMDCGYEDKMSRTEMKNCAKQLMLSFAANRIHDEPFDMTYCNLDPKGEMHQELYSFIPTMYHPEFPMQVTSKSYLDLFDKSKLVYLTPDCTNDIDKYDHDAIYIIGAIVDKVSGKPMSKAKAKREGIKMARLPIDKYLEFGGGSGKSLTLNQMIEILADVKLTGDWTKALRHVPQRKLQAHRQDRLEHKVRKLLKGAVVQSDSPQDFSIHARKKFRNY